MVVEDDCVVVPTVNSAVPVWAHRVEHSRGTKAWCVVIVVTDDALRRCSRAEVRRWHFSSSNFVEALQQRQLARSNHVDSNRVAGSRLCKAIPSQSGWSGRKPEKDSKYCSIESSRTNPTLRDYIFFIIIFYRQSLYCPSLPLEQKSLSVMV